MLVKKRMKIGKLFEEYATNPDVLDEVVTTKKPIYVKSESGKLVQLIGVIRKSKCKMMKLNFSNNISVTCASTHLLKLDNNIFKTAETITKENNVKRYENDGQTGIASLINRNIINNSGFAYDITMEEEHIYVTPNGLVHHNSMLAIQAMGNGQRVNNGDILTAFLDSEEATTTLRLSNLGVRNPRIKPYNDVTIEKVFKFLEGLCLFKEKKGIIDKPSVVIWDSIANTLSQKEREAEDINSVIGYKARLLSILVPKYVAKCAKYNISFIAVNQLRDVMNLGMFTAPKELKFMSTGKDMPGGNTLRFNAFQLIELKVREALTGEKGYGFDGFVATAKSVKNKLFSPNVSVDLVGNFVTGFSNFWTNYRFLVTTSRLTTGAWNYLVTLPDKKFRSKDALSLYREDKVFKESFDSSVKESIQKDIIDRYNPEIEDD